MLRTRTIIRMPRFVLLPWAAPALIALCLSPAPAAAARHTVPETRTVCAKSAWVEDAPAHRPHGVAYRHDTFRVDRYVHTAHKGTWAHGTHLVKDHSRGWIKLAALCASSSTDGLVGERKHVQIKQLLVYDDPAKSYIGSLQTGQSFTVTRLSPTKTYAYGFAYGKINRHVWVRTSKLLASVASAASNAPAGTLSPVAAMRKGIRDAARIEGHHATASQIHVSCGKRGKIGHTARCTGSFRLARHGRSATYTLTATAGVVNNSPGSLMYQVDSRADRKVQGLPSRTGLAGFLQ